MMKWLSAGRRNPGTSSSSTVPGKILVCLLVAVAVLGIAGWYIASSDSREYTVIFRNTAGLYEGDRVMVLGVPVGEVEDVDPRPDGVHVTITVKRQQIPQGVRAAIIAPTLVTGRYIQLAPAYDGGPALESGATVPLTRTATPVEFDQVKEQLVRLATDLGSTADGRGPLNRFLSQSSETLAGNGAVLNRALTQLSSAVDTLNQGGNDLFGTVEHLQQFVSGLAAADDQIVAFSDQLATFTGVLNDNRQETAALLSSLAAAFDQVKSFVDDNRAALTQNVQKANEVTGVLVDRVDTLAEILHALPMTVSNFYNVYDPVGNSLTGALGIPDIPDPQSLICALLTTVNAPEGECVTATRRLAENTAEVVGPGARKGGR